jgi:hypothetical protein
MLELLSPRRDFLCKRRSSVSGRAAKEMLLLLEAAEVQVHAELEVAREEFEACLRSFDGPIPN